MDCCIEIHSLSKTSNMTGWRIGFAVGNADIVAGLGKVKMNVDSGAFLAIQYAAIDALKNSEQFTRKMNKIYQERRDTLLVGLKALGIEMEAPKATFYMWTPVPGGKSVEYAKYLLENAGIVSTPGIGLGKYGEGYVRFSLTRPVERIREAVERMKKL
jgi:LL-diaminopimelate aminotransferase